MSLLSPKGLSAALGLLLLAGCLYPVRENADRTVCSMAARPLDLQPMLPTDLSAPMPPATNGPPLKQTAYQQPAPTPPLLQPLQILPELPGANAPLIQLPPHDPNDPQKREQAINKFFPPLPPLAPVTQPAPSPTGHPLTLADLQQLALSNSPVIRQAAADVEAARGAAKQAGLYPNPKAGYEGDTIATAGGAGYQGAFVEQTIKTGGKLKLAQAAAEIDVQNAQLALRRAQADLATQVRAGYFAVLVAQQNVSVARALSRFADEVYRVQVNQLKGAQIAAYEPLEFRVLAVQARGSVMQTLNRYTAAWKQLAATLGLPGLAPTELAGSVDLPIPVFKYEDVLTQILNTHTDVLISQNTQQKARYLLRLAQVTPTPDIDLRVLLQKDYTSSTFLLAPSVVVGLPVPVWDHNQGNIIQAQGNLLRAEEESHRVRASLTARLAEAFERYDTNRLLLAYYRDSILPDQVRVYRGVYERYHQEPEKLNFNDVVTSHQTLANAITTYVTTLGALWTAVADVANLLQTNDLFQTGEPECVAPVLDLEKLLPLPCHHPCSPLPDPALKGANGDWPPAVAGKEAKPMPSAEK